MIREPTITGMKQSSLVMNASKSSAGQVNNVTPAKPDPRVTVTPAPAVNAQQRNQTQTVMQQHSREDSFSRADTLMQAKPGVSNQAPLRRDDYLDNELGLASIEVQQRIQKASGHESPLNLSNSKAGNVIVQSILKMLEDKLPQAMRTMTQVPQTSGNMEALFAAFQRAALKKIASTGVQMGGQKVKRSVGFDLNDDEPSDSKGFLRVGDIILLTYDEKVFDELHDVGKVAAQTREGVQHLELLEEKMAQKDNLKERITNKPDLVYKGVLFTDGVTNKHFSVMPRQHTASLSESAFTQFKKCLFRIEVAQECKYNVIKHALLEHLEELEKQKASLNEEKALAGKGSTRRGNKDLEEIDKLYTDLENLEKDIAENEKRLSEEVKNNAYEFQINVGKKITYGQKIQLKHLFSDQYLSLNIKKISQEHGCVKLQLSPANENSWFTLTPSEKVKCSGQSISYLDTFYVQNYVLNTFEKPLFFMHVNNSNILEGKEEAVMEINGSFEPSKFRARLFLDNSHMKQDNIFLESGDVIRIKHEEANGYLTVFERNVELSLPELPDFLLRQVNKIDGMAFGGANNSALLNIMGENADDVDNMELREQAKALMAQQNEIKRKNQSKVFIERDQARLQFTNSCWEIQRLKTYHGGPMLINDICRLKHIGTGKFLGVSAVDRRELLLRDSIDESDTLFCIRRESFRPAGKKGPKPADGITGDMVTPHEQVILETNYHTFVHISEMIKESFSIDQAHSDKVQSLTEGAGQAKKDTSNKPEHEKQEERAQSMQKAIENELHEDKMRIEPVCGNYSRDDMSKMIFVFEKVPAQQHESSIAYQAASFYKALHDFYEFLNMWAVDDVDAEELEILGFNNIAADQIDKQKYDFQVARETDRQLYATVDELEECVIDVLIGLIQKAQQTGHDDFITIQRNLAEQGLLVMIVKLLELIYYKSSTPDERDRDLLEVEIEVNDNHEESPERIASEMLDPLAEKILRLLYLLIKENQANAEKLTKYDHVIFMMLTRYDAKLVAKIFKETYKRAKAIHGENNSGGGGQGGVMQKWVDRLESIKFLDNDENISRQILYLNVISMMCRDDHGNGLYHYQVQAVQALLDTPQKVPITFGVINKDMVRPIIFIHRKLEESDDVFLRNNPRLREVYRLNKSGSSPELGASIVIDLYDMTMKNLSSNSKLQPYIEYVAAVINLYCHICLSRNINAVKRLKDLGLTFEHIIACISQQQRDKEATGKKSQKKKNEKQIEPLDKKLIAAYIFAARVMYIDTNLFPTLSTYKNRCYFWDTIHKSDAHKTMYRWEKDKFFRGFEDNNRFLKEEQDQHEQLAMGQLRQQVYNFFSGMPDVLQTFLYSFESRRYTKKDVFSVLTLMFNFIDTATSLISCELVDSKFIYRMLMAAAMIFISYHYKEMPKTEEDKSWIYMVMQVAKKTKKCRQKIEVLEFKTLLMLEVICKFRMNAQILIFLQLFRGFVENNTMPHVSQMTTGFDKQFQVIFQLYQFNIGKNLTFKTIQRMAQKIAGNAKQLKGSGKNKALLAAEEDNGDANDKLLQIGEIRLTEDPNAGQGDGEDPEVDDNGNTIFKGGAANEDEDDEEGDGDEDKGEKNRRKRQYNDKYELDKFLLFLIFAKATNQGIRNQAVKVLVQNFNQRELLMNELTKVELIISTMDQIDYNEFMKQQFMLRGIIDRISTLGIEMKQQGDGVGRARDQFAYKRSIDDVTNILKGLTSNLQEHVSFILISVGEEQIIAAEQARLIKKQNMLRHMDIAEDLVKLLLKRVVSSGLFQKERHGEMFKEVARFLFMYSFGSLCNQRTLIHQLNFLVSLTDLDVPTPKLIAQILSQQRETEHGLRFLEFLTDKIVNHSSQSFKSSLFKLLALMMSRPSGSSFVNNGNSESLTIEANQIFVLKRLVKKAKFRKALLLDEENGQKKLDIVVSLNKRIRELKGFQQMTKADQVAYVALEWEAYSLHSSVVDALSACVKNSLFGRLQARKLATAEHLFDAVLSEAIPFLLRRKYLRLLFEVYIRTVADDTMNVDFNTKAFHDMMYYIVLEDLRQYGRYYTGLIAKLLPEAKRDNTTEALRKRTIEALQQKSIEDVRKRNMERTRQEMEIFKEERGKLSTLQSASPITLLDETDKSEYWKYLTQFKKSKNEADGLLHFIADFYTNVRRNRGKQMAKQLVMVTVQIRSVLMELSDDLNKINELYAEHLKDVDRILIVIDQTLSCIPNVHTFKTGKKFSVAGGGANAEDGEDVIVNEDDLDGDGIADAEEEEEEADRAAMAGEDRDAAEKALAKKKARDEANESKDLDEKIASDKILNIIRDAIVQDGQTIRQLFQIKSFEQNYIMPKLHLKKALKLIVASQATNDEVEKFMKYIDKFSRGETEQRRTIQPDIANEGHIRTRLDPLKVLQVGNKHADYFNFRDLENLLRKQLQKIQYKPPVQKRARDDMEEDLKVEKAEDELSLACNTDLRLFTKCFFDFFQRYRSEDEIADIVTKITVMFNEAFDKDQAPVIKRFIENMIQGFTHGKDKLYLLRILNMIIEYYQPTNPKNKHYPVKSRLRLSRIQVIMKDCHMLELLLHNVNEDDLKISDEAIKLMSNMLCESNQIVQDELLGIMKKNRDNFKFFTFIKNRLHSSSDFLVTQQNEKSKLKKQFIESSRHFKDNGIDSLSNAYQQPFYLPQQATDGQSVFNLENEIKRMNSQQSQDELLNILRLIQLLCDNCHQGFQDYLRNQEENSDDALFTPLTTVNLVSEVAMVLIKLTEKLGKTIFTDYILYETIGQVFDTLIDFLHGPNVENQKLLGQWKKLSKAVNFYLGQNMGYYAANTTELKAKLGIMKSCTDLLLALVESVDPAFKLSILQEMVPEICVENLMDKMVDIFHFKVGINDKKQRIYYSSKKCYHYRDNTPIRRSNLCEKDEFCEQGHLIKFDKQIIAAGFNIFIFLYNYKEVDPQCENLENFDSEFKNEKVFRKMKKEYEAQIEAALNISPEKYADSVQNNDIVKQEEIERKTLALLEDQTIVDPTTKIYPELAKKSGDANEGVDLNESGQLEKQVFEMKEEGNAAKGRPNERQGFWARLCRKGGKNKIGAQNKGNQVNQTKGEHDLLMESFESNTQAFQGAASGLSQGSSQLIQAQKEDVEQEQLEKYDIRQFLMDTALRFYSSNVSSIEIDYNNSLSKVMFRIPPFCTFLSYSSQHRLIYEADHDSHVEKLEDFFNKKKIFKAEMKAIQRLSRRSRMLRWGSEKWRSLSQVSLGMVLVINLLFVIFYNLGEDGQTIILAYREAEITIELLGIIQAFLAFLVMSAYIMRFHGKIHEEYMEQYKLESKDRFTRVKGSLGYAFGSEVFKLAHVASNKKEEKQKFGKDDEFSLERRQTKLNRDELSYAFKIFFISMKIDTQHAFNVVYFVLSVLGVFYHTIFSFLLLDIVIKIPLLSNVVQAIVQNRKQLFYTFVLLAIIIYIYSFIAFRVLRESYLSVDNSPDDPPDQNLYCNTLLQCFTSTMNNGLRAGGGIGDYLDQISMETDHDPYWMRYVFDLSFFFIVTILLLNLIFGIIIDAFADMRDARNAIDTDVKGRCFICGLNRFEFETKNKSWFDHVEKEHNAFAYLYFILYVQAKPGNQCTGVEKYVKALILKEDPAFFPVGKCLSIGFGSDPNRERDE